jgi:hypothetical protein
MTHDITAVTPPSLHLPSKGPRLLLIGEGYSWKNNIIKTLNGDNNTYADFTDVSVPPTVYYCDEEENYNWLYFQLPHIDQIIFYFHKDTSLVGSAFFGMLVSDPRLHVLHDGSANSKSILFLYADKNKRQPTTDPTNVLISVYNACY